MLVVKRRAYTTDSKPVVYDVIYQRVDRVRFGLKLRRTDAAAEADQEDRLGRFEIEFEIEEVIKLY